MNDMFKKVNAREKLIGWYHSGPKLRASDLEINELFKRYTPNPLLVIIDVQPTEVGVPTDAYFAVEEIKDDGTTTAKTFVHTPSIIEAEEAEEIGVEHLLRDIRDVAVGTLSTRITAQLQSLQGLHHRLRDISSYLQRVLDGDLPTNHAILGNLQDIFNLLPNLSTPTATTTTISKPLNSTDNHSSSSQMMENSELARSMSIKTNDQLMTIYLSSLVRAITAFHDLIENKRQNRQAQEEKDAKTKEEELGGAGDGEKKKSAEEKNKDDKATIGGSSSNGVVMNGSGSSNEKKPSDSNHGDDDDDDDAKDKDKDSKAAGKGRDKGGRDRDGVGSKKKKS